MRPVAVDLWPPSIATKLMFTYTSRSDSATRRFTSTSSPFSVLPRWTSPSGSSASCWSSLPWGANASKIRSPRAWRSSASVIRRCRARAQISTTSSTPASAAMSRTASMTRWRLSGRRIGGRGRDTSSKAMVRRIPANSSAGRGALSPRGFSSAWRTASPGSSSGSSGSGAYTTRELPAGSFSRRKPSPCQVWSGPLRGRNRGVPLSPLLVAQVEHDLGRPPPAGGGGVLDRLGVAVERVGRRHEAFEPLVGHEGHGQLEAVPPAGGRLRAVGVGAGEAHLALPQRGEVHPDRPGHADEHNRRAGGGYGEGLGEGLGAAHAVEHQVGSAGELPVVEDPRPGRPSHRPAQLLGLDDGGRAEPGSETALVWVLGHGDEVLDVGAKG